MKGLSSTFLQAIKSPQILVKLAVLHTGKERKASSVSSLPVLPATGNAVVKKTFSTTFGTCGFKEEKKKKKV